MAHGSRTVWFSHSLLFLPPERPSLVAFPVLIFLHSPSLMLSDSGVMLLRKWSVFELYLTAVLWLVIHSLKDKIFYGYLRIVVLKKKEKKKGEVCAASRPGWGTSVSLPHCTSDPEQDAKSTTAPEPGFSFCDWTTTSPRKIAQFYFYFVIEGEAIMYQILGDVTFFSVSDQMLHHPCAGSWDEHGWSPCWSCRDR